MAPTGFLDRALIVAASADLSRQDKMRESREGVAYTKALAVTLGLLKEIGSSKDVDLIVQSEASLLTLELQTIGAHDPSVVSSLKTATMDFNVIKNALKTVKNPVLYQAAVTTYHFKKKAHGVVADGCHEAMNSHITRLGNRMSAVGISISEKNILRQRQANMRIVKELYIDLQRKALGIESPVKSRSREQ